MEVNYELYKVFYQVAKTLNFSQAAKNLYISQSAVSQAIKNLEEQLATTLFIRSTKSVSLTKEGEILFEHIKPAFNLIQSGEQNLKAINSFEQGEIHLGANDTICKYYLLPMLKKFHQLYPQIHIQITNRTSAKCVELLKEGVVDLIISNLPNQAITDFMRVEKIFSFQDVFIAGDKYQSLNNLELNLADLTEYPLLMLEKNTTTRDFFDELITSYELNLKPEVELGSIDLLIEMALIELGISFVPSYCLQDKRDNLFTLNLKQKLPQRNLALVTNQKIPTSLASEKFIELLLT